jgi:hypothetical protein
LTTFRGRRRRREARQRAIVRSKVQYQGDAGRPSPTRCGKQRRACHIRSRRRFGRHCGQLSTSHAPRLVGGSVPARLHMGGESDRKGQMASLNALTPSGLRARRMDLPTVLRVHRPCPKASRSQFCEPGRHRSARGQRHGHPGQRAGGAPHLQPPEGCDDLVRHHPQR